MRNIIVSAPGKGTPGENTVLEGKVSAPKEGVGREQFGGGQCVSPKGGGCEGTIWWRVMRQLPGEGALGGNDWEEGNVSAPRREDAGREQCGGG